MNNTVTSSKIAISIVTYKSSHIIKGLLETVPKNIPIYICDNSQDSGIESAIKDYDVNLYISPKNLGFGKGHNYNLQKIFENQTDAEFIAIINPDCALNSDTLQSLINAAGKYPDAAVFAPKLYDGKGSEMLTYKPNIFKRNYNGLCSKKMEGDICAEFISGAFYIIRINYLRQHQLFDPNIFLFHEDDDFCISVYKNGSYAMVVNDSKCMHLVGKSSKPSWKLEVFKNIASTNSRIYIEYKYKGFLSANILKIRIFCATLAKVLAYACTLNFKKLAKYAGKFCGIFYKI
ncbi:MAG: glycosyltransferase family 2 protein [Alphaproteobacteria bacterium]|nr:glycosyltransferase family 2 protein [Alphaproteobacteria bacterium]OJV14229.1 MAG: hypothetical protein BGO27_01870 [Alphaproteobacteria bacterium 33-17]